MVRVAVFMSLILCAGCTEADRAPMFSTARAPLVGRCDPQPGYPPPEQRPGCWDAQLNPSVGDH
jgi:hypothetical protein